MSFKYYNSATETIIRVSWRTLDEKGQVLNSLFTQACFSPITYNAIPENVKKIVVSHNLNLIPYSKEICEKWIEEINALGFPVSISFQDEKAEFTIDLSKYEFKMHVSSTLQLIRCLFETTICVVPEFYFNTKAESLEEKFIALQNAHSAASSYFGEEAKVNGYQQRANTNHMVTYTGNFQNPITRKTLFGRIKNTKLPVYSEEHTNLSDLWSDRPRPEDENF